MPSFFFCGARICQEYYCGLVRLSACLEGSMARYPAHFSHDKSRDSIVKLFLQPASLETLLIVLSIPAWPQRGAASVGLSPGAAEISLHVRYPTRTAAARALH